MQGCFSLNNNGDQLLIAKIVELSRQLAGDGDIVGESPGKGKTVEETANLGTQGETVGQTRE